MYMVYLIEFVICREWNEELLEYECELSMDSDILKGSVAYKYCVQESKQKECYERIYGSPGSNIVNRCLRLTKLELERSKS